MENYEKVTKDKQKTEENEIRVTSKGLIKSYLGYAFRVLEEDKLNMNELVIKATGNAIVKALILIELVKRRIGNLHQINDISSMEIVDQFEPKIEGLQKIEQKRRVTAMETRLLKKLENESDTQLLGYQPPEPKEERSERSQFQPKRYNDPQPRGGEQKKTYNKPLENRDRDERGPRQVRGDAPRGRGTLRGRGTFRGRDVRLRGGMRGGPGGPGERGPPRGGQGYRDEEREKEYREPRGDREGYRGGRDYGENRPVRILRGRGRGEGGHPGDRDRIGFAVRGRGAPRGGFRGGDYGDRPRQF